MKQVLYLGPEDSLAVVKRSVPPEYRVEHALDDDAVERLLPTTHAVLDASMRIRFDAARIGRASVLRAYVTATTGADHVDSKALDARGIPLLTLKGQKEILRGLSAAAEHSWLLLMACARKLRPAIDHVLAGSWERTQFPGMMLKGKTLGIVGCGRIGTWMSRYAAAFGMKTIGFDPQADPWPDGVDRVELDALLATADIVSVHVPLNDDTKQLLKARELGLCKPGVVVINTSRGEIIDESALLQALESGHVAALGLDVLVGEPETANHPLVVYARTHDNVVITPHIGGFCPEAVREVVAFSCKRIVSVLEDAK